MANHESDCRYDIFLSFRGEDTRHSFTGNLYYALQQKGFKVFIDDDGLKGGDQISLSLVKAIEESRISVVVFSENYASSSWCLDELVKIVECMQMKNQLVWPIFYKVAPSDVRHQRNSYGKAMTEHESRFGNESERVQSWRSALSKVANVKGLQLGTGYEYQFIQMIVEWASTELRREQLYVGKYLIGHQSRIEEVKSLIHVESNDAVCMVGIHGTGGIGKTTFAKALYNLIVDQFECAIFLEDVRETSNKMGLVHLQEIVLSKLPEGKTIKLGSVGEGVARLKDMLHHRKLLLVLDDVDSDEQLEKLAGECDWFGSGSRIIITTRDKHLLNVHKVEKRYEMKELNDHESLQLFCLNAFKMNQPATNYEDVSNRAICYAKGLPLALKVIGSNLFEKSLKECECALNQYERIPERKIQEILKVSYDCLQEKAQHVFLDIACFFKGESWEYVEKILDRCDFFPAFNIRVLVDKSLLIVDEYGCLRMHDLIQDMGKEVVRQQAREQPVERSRLCSHEDVLCVLRENSGSINIQGIILDPPKKVEVECSGFAFEKMNNLRILIVRNACLSSAPNSLPNSLRLLEWMGYPSKSLPSDFNPKNIVVLRLPESHLTLEMEKPFRIFEFEHLTEMDFSFCLSITHVPDMSGVPNLVVLKLSRCENLIAIHSSVGKLRKLRFLDAELCTKLKNFAASIWLPSLKELCFFCCTSFELFPDIEGVMDQLWRISLCGTRIKELPHSVYNLTGLLFLEMSSCTTISNLPKSLFMLPQIATLDLKGSPEVRESFQGFQNSHVISTIGHCNLNKPRYSPLFELSCINCGLTDEDLHCILGCTPKLEKLVVSKNSFVSLPACIKESAKLKILDVSDCVSLQKITELPSSIEVVIARCCTSLTLEASEMLWSQVFNETYRLQVVMPESQFPTWFDHCCEGGIVSFWIRGRFPIIALAFIFKDMQSPTQGILYTAPNLYINGKLQSDDRLYNYSNFDYGYEIGYSNYDYEYTIEGDHVLLFDVRYVSNVTNHGRAGLNEWNYVEFKCDLPKDWTVTYCGAHVYKQETNMDDIRFTWPNPLKRPPSFSHNPPKKRARKFKPRSGGRRKENRKARRRSTQFQSLSSGRRMKMVFSMSKLFWRFFWQ